ncbi:MAG TPA: PASTA domain-containing protein [Solirubrobacterales bacterium]
MSGRVLIGLAAFLFVAVAPVAATADVPPPPYTGDMTFPQITDPSGPEEFTWQVQLNENEVLEAIDEEFAAVYHKESHSVAFLISAEHAHDASGAKVPTSLTVTEPDLITLVVHHRAGNPANGGAAFDYPIVAGEGWEEGYGEPIVVEGPMDERELREERERLEREIRERNPPAAPASSGCGVPALKGLSLRAAKRRLLRSGCGVGRVRKRHGARLRTGTVVRQAPRPGSLLPAGSAVSVTLAGGRH